MKNNTVGNNVRMIRRRLGITQEELALKSGLTQGYINFLENGKRGYSRVSLEKIVNALGIQMSGLFEEKKMLIGTHPIFHKSASNIQFSDFKWDVSPLTYLF